MTQDDSKAKQDTEKLPIPAEPKGQELPASLGSTFASRKAAKNAETKQVDDSNEPENKALLTSASVKARKS